MLMLSFALLCAAVAIGAGLAVVYLRGPRTAPPPAAVPLAHAALGAAGLGALLGALYEGLPHTGMGISGFGPIAGAFLALALLSGLLLAWAAWRRRRPAGMLVGTHASLAIAGFVVLLTLVALR